MPHAMHRLIPFLADAIGVGLAFLLLAPLTRQIEELAFINSVILGLVFLLFCFAVYALKKLAPAGTSSRQPPALGSLLQKRPLTVLGIIFALAYSLAIAYTVGFLDSIIGINRFLLDEPAVTVYLLLTPASWFGLSLIYMLLLSTETEQTVQPGTARYSLLALLGLSGVNLTVVVLTSVGQAFWTRVDPPGGPTFVFLLTFLLYLLLFGPPRLLYQAKQPRPWWLGLISFLPFLLYMAWLVVG